MASHRIGENGHGKMKKQSFYAQRERINADNPFPDRLFFWGGLSKVGRNKCKQIDSFKRSRGVKDVVKPVFTLLDCFALERFFMPTF